MIQKIKSYLLTATSAVMLMVPAVGVATLGTAMAADCNNGISNNIVKGVNNSAPDNNGAAGQVGCSGTGVNDDSITNLAKRIITTFSIIVGAASVIMIIYGGFRYITSGGESGRVGAAKNALLYAIIGLVIVALAQLIIRFVLSQANQVGTS
ncbi:MAG TPA: pilin [Candidatus Saccharimonadales bacterium]|nr:pilin [Candidatus Saccharimonadales bacterium]